MRRDRAALEAEFMRLCRTRGPAWIESVIRPLKLPGHAVTVRDIPDQALRGVVQVFGGAMRPILRALAR
jgi:hypothetical protein